MRPERSTILRRLTKVGIGAAVSIAMLLPMGATATAAEGDGGKSAASASVSVSQNTSAAPSAAPSTTPQKSEAPKASPKATPQKTASATPKAESKSTTPSTPAQKAPAKTPAPSAAANSAQQSGGASANAGCSSSDTACGIKVGSTVSGRIIDDDDDDWYKFAIPANGVINLTFSNQQTSNGQWLVTLYDSNLKELDAYTFDGKSPNHPATTKIGVPGGTYWVKVDCRGWDSPAFGIQYNLRANYTRTAAWETEWNDGFDTADPLAAGSTISGVILNDDDYDWYKVTTSRSDTAQIQFSNEQAANGQWLVTLIDSNLNELYTERFDATATSHAGKKVTLPAGVHYIRVDINGGNGDAPFRHQYNVRLVLSHPDRYTVAFNSNGGSRVASQTVTSGSRVSQPKNPTRSGYTFAGWYTAANGGARYDFSSPVTANRTLYAHWNKNATIQSIAAVSVTTRNGVRPTLPSTVTATYTNGTKRAVKVSWPYIYSGQFAKAGTFTVYGTVSGTNVKARATIRVVAVVTSIPAISVSTNAGTRPKLPATVNAKFSDGVTRTVKVSWPYIYSGQYAKAGSFTVNGTVAGTNVKARATVKVNPVVVRSIAAISVSTVAGTRPKLPATVRAVYSDGVTRTVKVSWPYIYSGQYAKAGSFTINGTVAGTNVKARATVRVTARPAVKQVPVYRVYNRNSGLHHYTRNAAEKNMLVRIGWRYEGVSFITVPGNTPGAKPVYREYNRRTGNHNWTMNKKEHDMLVRIGWKNEGVSWYAPANGKPVYRLYNRNSGEHVYTMSYGEYVGVQRAGWRGEGVAWKSL
ncbi:L,D-transpeptidase catalytic domain-containing protein [Bifidobacterium margollesii]|uniref:L,D-transpeptidase catalytic domain-containing protein n=1 Tax=Bifidobacterium margollesii TaxID=2020964 RepID=A0A2N5J6Y6_9BIFI|nr:Ig-like domain-containing protein [Bifidobacterium margollesii]PLS29968.1 L,D-transpeptidase catalytic domain-containing protein [Bifidobacterium margollesii]